MTAPRRLQLRRGNATAISSYTGAAGEVVIDTTNWILYVHDGSTVGGYATTTNVAGITGNITQANLGLKGYVDLANTIQSQQISSANLGMKGYVDSVASQSIYGNANVASYLHTYNYSPYSNVNVAVYTNLSTYAWNANVTAANLGLKGYVDLANTIQSDQISAANIGMKGYVDSVASQSIYGNSNVKSYLTSGFDGNILPSANVTYSLGSPTRQWRDLFVSNTTIYLGGVPLSIDATGNLLVNGNVVQGAGGGTNLVTYSGNVSASAIILSGVGGGVSGISVLNPGGYIANLTICDTYIGSGSGTGLKVQVVGPNPDYAIYAPGSGYQVGDSVYVINPNYATPGYSNAALSVTSILSTPTTPAIFVGNTAYKFGADGNLTLPHDGYLGNVWGEPSETTLVAAPGGFVAIANSSGDQYVDANDNNVQIGTNYRSGGGNVWLFYQNGWLVFPDNTVQTTAYTGYGNTQVGVYTNLSTYAYAANVTAANVGIKGYIDLANTIQSAQVGAANLAITAANVGMKGYVDSQTFYSNARVATYLQYGATSNISVAGNVTATYFVGNGALLTGIAASSSYSNVQVAAYLSTATINTTGNITAGNLITSGALYVANITTTGASGNISGANYITANYFVGNGSQLTGLPAGYSNVQTAAYLNATGYNLYSNVNVASYLSTATINTTGNITAQYLTGNINITGNVTGTSANVTLQAGSYSSVFDNQGNVTVPRLFANGNVQSTGYIFGNGAFLTGVVTGSSYSNVQVATYLPTYTGVVGASNVFVSGNVTAQYLFGNGSQLTGIASSYSNVQVATYLPTYTGNIANIRLGVSGVLTFADGTTLSTASAIAGSNYGNGNVASYLITNGYVNTNSAYANGNVASYLITNQYINANSAYGNGNVTSYLPTHSGNVGVNNLIGTTPNVTLQANSYSSTFDIYGNVAFGNAAYPVQIYATGAITTNSNLTVGGMGVVMPNRPAFRVNGTAAPITTANVNLKGSAITTVFNQGNYLDTTTGKFTAPIAGIYEVLLNARVGTYNGLSQIAVLKNGNNSQGNVVCFWEIGSTTGTANHFGVSGTINLVAGDYLSANILAGNISFDGNDNWCVTYLG